MQKYKKNKQDTIISYEVSHSIRLYGKEVSV